MATWKIKKSNPDIIKQLMKEFKVPKIIAMVMAGRGLKSLSNSKSFFNPTLKNLHDPFLMKNMKKAANLLKNKIIGKKKIFIFGDYDVDGTTGSSALYLFLNSIDCDAKIYIPHRISEGYGLSVKGINNAIEWGANLIISCDCGINAIQEVAYAKSKGLDIIVTDHHTPDTNLPAADAIINPNQTDCQYPFKGLCGGAVIFKLMQAVSKLLNLHDQEIFEYLDLITLGTSSDVVPLIDENRIIVKQGLSKLFETRKPGLRALLEISGLNEKELSVEGIIFQLAPIINAAGRLGDPNRVIKLFSTESYSEAQKLTHELDNENKKRRKMQHSILEESIRRIHSEVDLKKEKAIVLWDENWHEGIVGIVAAQIKEIYHRPTILISLNGGIGKGSARSIPGFNLFNNLYKCKETLMSFGGHPMAAGLTLNQNKLLYFKKSFLKLASTILKDKDLVNSLDIEGELDLNLIHSSDSRFMNFLDKLGPFGPENEAPIFITRNVQPLKNLKLIGKKGEHIKFSVRHNNSTITAIGFNKGKDDEKISKSKSIDIAYVVEKNYWRGNTSIQLNIKDIKF
ncbi:MAG: single-stranded-DNA-specific exonuclease RecJ [Candidatus Marinimicrobia bacterium]|nr:single-stranded-DNA-specific exonuclease RecJ [Candidatus Neomarinimicrobiota bacterium]|tara:strand:+ start:2869 stop:4575 length:1707 start_codon:yes stop_codon:yes gene_type:complete